MCVQVQPEALPQADGDDSDMPEKAFPHKVSLRLVKGAPALAEHSDPKQAESAWEPWLDVMKRQSA